MEERKRTLGNFEHILSKLEGFSKKYYTKLLVKGILLFLTFGLLLFLLVTGAEYMLWLSPAIRSVLFFGFLLALIGLGYRYIIVPISYLSKLKKGINEKQASRLIGKHFPKIGDRLLNLLELSESEEKSDLLLAAIEQRSFELRPLPFSEAVNLKESLQYGRYLIFPVLIIVLVWASGSIGDFFGSYNRVMNYDVAYEPPAPFEFVLQNENLSVMEDGRLKISVLTTGEAIPESVMMELNDGPMLMQNKGGGIHEFVVQPPIADFTFRFVANEFTSRVYRVESIKVPAITDFRLKIDFPGYLRLKTKTVNGTGNITVPEGSRVTWSLKGINTSEIQFITRDTTVSFTREERGFNYSKRFFNAMEYELATSNDKVRHYERLGYRLNVVKDASPEIRVEQLQDSLQVNELYFSGAVSDDHAVGKVDLVYYAAEFPNDKKHLTLLRPNSNVAQFYYTFPSGIQFEQGRNYEFYFEARDNDGLRGGKVVRSKVFKTTILDDKQLIDKQLKNKESIIKNLGKSLDDLQEQNELLKEINTEQKQEGNLEYRDKERIKQFLNKQKQQEGLMEKFSRELKNNLQEEERSDELNQLLQERLERQELEAKKNQKLLEELEKVADKIEKEELKERLEELAKSQSSGKRNLEQLLELTKRYYVTEKAAQLGQKLDTLSRKQESLSKQELQKEASKKEQEKLNQEFEDISKELDELKGDNRALRKPMELDYSKNQQESIKKDQEDALEEINKHQDAGTQESSKDAEDMKKAKGRAAQKQSSAAQKMKELSERLQESMSGAGGSSGVVEDAEMLRQILDNLITFSFKQESLFERVNQDVEIGEFSSTVRNQKELRQLFEHVDDSLFALSLRRAELSEFVNEQITEVYYNVDKSLESIADNQIYQAASYQQYVLNASNSLADFLADILDNMQQSMMSGQGQGQGQGFQLPDIIKKQGELQEKMEGGSESGSEGEPNSGESGQQGNKSGEGQQGENAQEEGGQSEGNSGQGKEGQEGKEVTNGTSNGGTDGGSGDGLTEAQLKEIYEIYQEQQTIRKSLEEQLKNIIDADKRDLARKLALQMEQFENELLESGITKRTENRINEIQHQLLKLENAALKQGRKKERESKTNQRDYSAPILTKPELLAPQNSEIEILNRQALPLRPDYQNKVKEYFGNGNQL
ncbi:MAG: hypothetical protein AAGC45_00070 [Bacteroidota bacterium]